MTVGLVGDLPVGLGMGVEEIMLTVSENVFVDGERHQIGDVEFPLILGDKKKFVALSMFKSTSSCNKTREFNGGGTEYTPDWRDSHAGGIWLPI